MKDALRFDPTNYQVKTCTLGGRSVTYRAFEGLDYCAAPLDPIQKLNLFVPEVYYDGAVFNGYTLHTAPIFAPNTVGGYMPGPADEPGLGHRGNINAVFEALLHGYVVACAGIRGRTSGKRSDEFFEGGKATADQVDTGRFVGKAPALIVDMKAAVRYLRHNRDVIPGDTEHIITNGTSAGGALSALTGATGNSPDYASALAAIGAAEERDDVFAASCYCPIHNLEHADAAYEWLFCGHDHYSSVRFRKVDGKVVKKGVEGDHTPKQQRVSQELKAQFPAYLNSLNLRDEAGNSLTLNADGTGSFQEYVKQCVLASAQRELDTHDSAVRLKELAVAGSEVEQQSYLTIRDGKVVDLDWDGFVTAIIRMKSAPAFDALDLKSPENEEFGTETVPAKHFTPYGQANSEVESQMADEKLIHMMNPTCYIGNADTAKHWRVRHGAYDRDTSLAIPVILATLLQNRGFDIDFALPWGLPHSGDYDLDDLFAWIDGLCR
ncbi:MAG: alpha/beta hydrolase [Clostridiales bacterium]|nr:alpha/beta hydrolase [Clostridiales bacterium]